MTNNNPPKRVFPAAKVDAQAARHVPSSPQTESAAYKLAFQDNDFLLREDLRPVRFQLELLKTELLLDEANIASTFVFYGSARVPEPAKADELIEAARGDKAKAIAESLKAKSRYYDIARELAQMVSQYPLDDEGKRHFVVCSGGGPSFMEAANRGAIDMGKETIGLNIVLPHEQLPNPYVTPDLSFQFHYFALRKMHFLLRARAVAVFPGGFGTFDEMFELLTLIQTGKMRPMPILLFGREFWNKVVDFQALADEGVVSQHDLDLITWCESAEEAWSAVRAHYREGKHERG
ncbi:LOG family protein [Sphingomonas sp.]|uniref:LOG family protein n=1 Tax=Sphingomonas sp. TaxID=28214 RepID=UPI00286B18E8|nr:LOG family protein [Sphingomonas sp.]